MLDVTAAEKRAYYGIKDDDDPDVMLWVCGWCEKYSNAIMCSCCGRDISSHEKYRHAYDGFARVDDWRRVVQRDQ